MTGVRIRFMGCRTLFMVVWTYFTAERTSFTGGRANFIRGGVQPKIASDNVKMTLSFDAPTPLLITSHVARKNLIFLTSTYWTIRGVRQQFPTCPAPPSTGKCVNSAHSDFYFIMTVCYGQNIYISSL